MHSGAYWLGNRIPNSAGEINLSVLSGELCKRIPSWTGLNKVYETMSAE